MSLSEPENVKIVEEALNVLIEQLTINNCLHIMIVCDIHVYIDLFSPPK